MSNQTKSPRVSVVLNTCNRGAFIGDTLEGLKRQTYDNFEVVVVNGPSIDETEEVVKKFNIRYYTAPFNISVSRNVGIRHAAGEIIAFIDDDAVPEAEWLEDIVKAYKDPKVAAAGGRVYNADGSDFQYSYGAIDTWGYPESRHDKAYDYNDPNGIWFNINIGTNASYRREPLIEVGGFDEEIEYYHDESDVCVRLIRAGYKVAQLEDAYVHHKMAPSFRRKSSKRTVVWDAIVKNTIYYGIKHTKGVKPLRKRLIRPFWTEKSKLKSPFHLLRTGEFTFFETMARFFSLIRAFWRGYYRGFFQPRKLIKNYEFEPDEFLAYKKPGERPEKPLNIVLVNQGFPPDETDGNARHNGALAKELAAIGHNLFVVSRAKPGKHATIKFQWGAWVYRHQPERHLHDITSFGRVDNQVAHARSVLETVRKINEKNKIDFILTPVWDVEGLALIKHKVAPVILSLMSPLKKVVETQWFNANDPSYDITYDLEKYCVEHADAVMPISNNIKKTIGDLYGIDWQIIESDKNVETIPLGVDSQFIMTEEAVDEWYKKSKENDSVEVLYVGRFERRKGIDLLLDVIPKILAEHKNVTFRLVGDNSGEDENGVSYLGEFEAKYKQKSWYKNIIFKGYVTEDELAEAYRNCDIFAAPSRYESFGQIYIEAMASAKPVIGVNVGGIPEIVQDGKNGFLITNESTKELHDSLAKLIKSSELREKMGRSSAEILRKDYASDVWAEKFLTFADKLIQKK